MEYQRLGDSGLTVSRIAFGNSLTHGNQVDDAVAARCVRTALDAGVTTFDTADSYADGRAEEVLGKALAGVDREQLVLCTKVGRRKGGSLSRKHILASVDGSLTRLGADHIDLYQAHRHDPDVPVRETVLAFADLVRAGKVRYVGVSEWPVQRLREAAVLAESLGVPFVSHQRQYSMLWRVGERTVAPVEDELGIGRLAWSPAAGGVLTGKYRPGSLPDGTRATAAAGGARLFGLFDFLDDAVLEAVARLAPLAREAGLTMAQLAVAWVLRSPAVPAAIVGASRPEQLAETVGAVGVGLDDDLLALIDAALGPVVRR